MNLGLTHFFLYHLKTSEKLQFSDVFRGYRKRPVTCNGLIFWIFLSKSKRVFAFSVLFNKQLLPIKNALAFILRCFQKKIENLNWLTDSWLISRKGGLFLLPPGYLLSKRPRLVRVNVVSKLLHNGKFVTS